MPFSERADFKDERRPLLRDPVWHYNHRYGRTRGQDQEEMEELFGRENTRNQRFQWMLFLGVTFLSILILLGTMGVLIKLSETHPPMEPKYSTTTTPPPFSNHTISPPGLPMTQNRSTTPPTSSPSDINVYVNKPSPQENT